MEEAKHQKSETAEEVRMQGHAPSQPRAFSVVLLGPEDQDINNKQEVTASNKVVIIITIIITTKRTKGALQYIATTREGYFDHKLVTPIEKKIMLGHGLFEAELKTTLH